MIITVAKIVPLDLTFALARSGVVLFSNSVTTAISIGRILRSGRQSNLIRCRWPLGYCNRHRWTSTETDTSQQWSGSWSGVHVWRFIHYCKEFGTDVVFLSRPWGGPEYLHQSFVPPSDQTEFGRHPSRALQVGSQTKEDTRRESSFVKIFLPRNLDLVSMGTLVDGSGLKRMEVEIMRVSGSVKGLTVFSHSGVLKTRWMA